MMEFIKNSAFFGAMISLIAYEIGLILKKKFKMNLIQLNNIAKIYKIELIKQFQKIWKN